jgi:hypothetical protein
MNPFEVSNLSDFSKRTVETQTCLFWLWKIFFIAHKSKKEWNIKIFEKFLFILTLFFRFVYFCSSKKFLKF